MAVLSDWQIFMDLRACPCGPPLSQPRPHGHLTTADLGNLSWTCKSIRDESGSLMNQTVPIYSIAVSFCDIEEFNRVFPCAEPSLQVWLQVEEPMKMKPPTARASLDVVPLIEMLSSGATIHLPSCLELVGVCWDQWKALMTKGELRHVSLSYKAERGDKLRYIISDEAGLAWQSGGFNALNIAFPQLALLAEVESLFQCGIWGAVEVKWQHVATPALTETKS